ncbi:MAG: OsmC family protein [Defluviitaleaceae bacterium]|nr:OsmC family protein [Defluviitaleaceae bacterium]MCL2835828.1 OsmC family protein [Defluviitaleaceae bacterium]
MDKVTAVSRIIDKTKVSAEIDGLTLIADIPAAKGGGGEYPTPVQMWAAALLNCSMMTLRGFCQSMELSTEGIGLELAGDTEKGIYQSIEFIVTLPEGFPEQYIKPINSVFDACTVTKIMKNLPEMKVTIKHN